jgi:membrane associated rhomboid family serine protease
MEHPPGETLYTVVVSGRDGIDIMTLFAGEPKGRDAMAMDFETVRFFRIVFAVVGFCIGGAAGIKYYGATGGLIGGVIGAIVGWNTPDLFKGRTQK